VLIVSFLLSVFVVMSSVCLSSLARHFGPVIKTQAVPQKHKLRQGPFGLHFPCIVVYYLCVFTSVFFVTPVSVLLVCADQ
jgi:hypothetical protein